MAKPSLESCRVNPGDGFQYLSSYQNVSRWKNRNWWKKVSKNFFLTNFLKGYFKAFPEKPFFSKKILFRFLSKIRFWSWKNVKPLFPTEKTGKSWLRNKILWLSDENSRKKSQVPKYPNSGYDFRIPFECKKVTVVLFSVPLFFNFWNHDYKKRMNWIPLEADLVRSKS